MGKATLIQKAQWLIDRGVDIETLVNDLFDVIWTESSEAPHVQGWRIKELAGLVLQDSSEQYLHAGWDNIQTAVAKRGWPNG